MQLGKSCTPGAAVTSGGDGPETLWCKETVRELLTAQPATSALVETAQANEDAVMPGIYPSAARAASDFRPLVSRVCQ